MLHTACSTGSASLCKRDGRSWSPAADDDEEAAAGCTAVSAANMANTWRSWLSLKPSRWSSTLAR